MVKPIFIAAQIYSFGSTPARGSKMVLHAAELSDMIAGQLVNLAGRQSFCYVAIKEEPFNSEDTKHLEEMRADMELNAKTPAQRLRAVLFRLWEQSPEDANFNDYYSRVMEKIINHYKEKLP